MGWVILAVYVIGYILFVPALARILNSEGALLEGDDKESRIIAIITAMILALFWPLVFPIGLWYRHAFGKKNTTK